MPAPFAVRLVRSRMMASSMEPRARHKLRSYTRAAKLVKIAPKDFDAVIFDMDGVATKTQKIHSTAWKNVFDEFLELRNGSGFEQFTIERDYRRFVDGRSRYDGVQAFLQSRGIELPWGDPKDAPGFDTVCGIANLKNDYFLKSLEELGVEPYETTIALIRSLRSMGIKTAVVTASQNGESILRAANILHVFDAKVDGTDAIRMHLNGKPAPDMFLEAAKQLKVDPARSAVVEDAPSGVEAGKKGEFKLVIGVNRGESGELLKEHGADVVVNDLLEVGVIGESNLDLPSLVCADLSVDQPNWNLVYDRYEPGLEGRREALCALGNGYFVTRASAPEAVADEIHYPGTYAAGLYNRLTTDVGDALMEHEDLVNLPNWLALKFRIDNGGWISLDSVEILNYKQTLNILEGILYREIEFCDEEGRVTSIFERRFVHMRHYHMAGLETTIKAKNWSGSLKVRSAIDGRVINDGVKAHKKLSKRHLVWLTSDTEDDIMILRTRTAQSRIEVATAVRTRVIPMDQSAKIERYDIKQPEYVAQNLVLQIKEGDEVTIEKTCALYTSRDIAISEPAQSARNALDEFDRFWRLVDDQVETWRHLWKRFDLNLETTADTSRMEVSLVLHLHSFHILQTVSPNSAELDVGCPARGWTGEAYQGHIFWDDIFVFPFLNLRMPEITRGLLRYRYRRLAEARKLAKSLGARGGACFPWQSASDGREETPKYMWSPYVDRWNPEHTNLQIHVNAAIAYNVWQYYQATGDGEFMNAYGTEVLLEIARFFGSFAKFNPDRDKFEIHGICGPDEYHAADPRTGKLGINNNAYTNMMTVWTLSRAVDLLNSLPDDQYNEICERLDLYEPELELWENISRKMFMPIEDDGIINQFEGFEKLEDFPWQKDGRIDEEKLKEVLQDQGGQLPQYKVAKQADVLMLFYLLSLEELEELFWRLGYNLDTEMIRKNIEYYAPRTAHNSTLSRVAQAWVLSRLDRSHAWRVLTAIPGEGNEGSGCPAGPGDMPETGIETNSARPSPPPGYDTACNVNVPVPSAWDIFMEALASDFFDIQGGSTAEGIHIGAMAGTIDIVQRCYTGIVIRNEVLWIKPKLPEGLMRLSFNLHYRKVPLHFDIVPGRVKITALQNMAEPIKIGFRGRVHRLVPGRTVELSSDS